MGLVMLISGVASGEPAPDLRWLGTALKDVDPSASNEDCPDDKSTQPEVLSSIPNSSRHACTEEVQQAPAKDFFAAACTCPAGQESVREKSARIKDFGVRAQQIEDRIMNEVSASPQFEPARLALKQAMCENCSQFLGDSPEKLMLCMSRKLPSDSRERFLNKTPELRLALQKVGWTSGESSESKPISIKGTGAPDFGGFMEPPKRIETPKLVPAISHDQCLAALDQPEFMDAKQYLTELFLHRNQRMSSPAHPPLDTINEDSFFQVSDELYDVMTKARQRIEDEIYAGMPSDNAKQLFATLHQRAVRWASARVAERIEKKCGKKGEARWSSSCNDLFAATHGALATFSAIKFDRDHSVSSDNVIGASTRAPISINFGPAVMELADRHPDQFSWVLAHELGHTVYGLLFGEGSASDADELSCLRSAMPSTQELTDDGKDRMSEAFPDWFGTELMVRRIEDEGARQPPQRKRERYLEMGRFLCSSGGEEGSAKAKKDIHPISSDRLGKIVAAHPSVRIATGGSADVPAEAPYCPIPRKLTAKKEGEK